MKNVATGDRQALRVLYERYAEFVFRIAFRFVCHEEDARDITQSVFLTLMQKADRYQPNAKLTTWLYRVVVNRCLNHRAKASQRQREPPLDHDHLVQLQGPERDRPDCRLESAQRTELVRDALLKLPERQRLAVVLSRFEQLSYEEIAVAMACTTSSVQSLLFRARQSLRKFFPA